MTADPDTIRPAPRLRLRGIRKSFGATRALDGVDLTVAAGEIHALIGENGAGKSTLMKVLSGAHQPDAGSIELDGAAFQSTDPRAARLAGIGMIYQELNLAPDLSVEENILLGALPQRWGVLRKADLRARATAALKALDSEHLPLRRAVRLLALAEQQCVEIARALVGDVRILILDEPTSSLTRPDVEKLFAVIRRLRDRGIAVIYISHFLEECRSVCSRYTVLRDGCSVGTGNMDTTDDTELIRLMVGREVDTIFPRQKRTPGDPVLKIENLSAPDNALPRDVSLTLRRGEVLGLAGLIGSGRTETARLVFGLDPVGSGSLTIGTWSGTAREPAINLACSPALGLVSEDRKGEGLLLNRPIRDNLTATRWSPVRRGPWLSTGRQRSLARGLIDRLSIKARDSDQTVQELSGGNQQKVALGRLLHHDADIWILDEPTRGIDIGSKAEIYHLIGDLAANGKAILMISSYLPELLGVCDTIGVMNRGRLVATRPVVEWNEHRIMAAAVAEAPNHLSR
ncbi:MAG: sugar ABC transporter ATP-binding protein [Opitutales bacterium]